MLFHYIRYGFICIIVCCTSVKSIAQINHLHVPKGFSLSLFATGLDDARQMAKGNQGTIFVGSRNAGTVWALQDTNNDGKADKQFVIAKGLNMPSGLAFQGRDLYVGAVGNIYRFRDIEQHLPTPPKPEIAFSNLPNKTHHGWKFLAFSPEGELFVPVGAPCNVCEESDSRFASILKVQLDTDKYEIVAHGVRNSVGFDWHPQSGELWFSDNGRDMLGDDVPPCEINRASQPGLHFGFPYIHAGSIIDPEFFDNHNFSDYQPPVISLDAHVAPLGIHFYEGDMFPAHYKNQLFVAEHGSWNRSKKAGYRVMLATFKNQQMLTYEPIVWGFLKGQETRGRPVAFLELDDGSVLISDDYADQIYRLTYNKKK